MINNQNKCIEDDFDLESYKRNAIIERIKKNDKKNKLVRDRVLMKIASYIIMIVFIVIGGFLYRFLSELIYIHTSIR